MHDVGIIVAYTFCEALTSSSYKSFHIFYRISRTSYGRSLFSHALCIMSGLSLPRLFLRSSHLAPSCIMHDVGIIVAQSRDYCCPESGLSLPRLFLRSSHFGLLQGLPCFLQAYASLIRSIRSIASRLALRRPGTC